MVSLHPTLPLGDFGKLQSLAPDLAEAAREVHAGWEQVDGLDPDLGVGGICHDVAAAMCGVLDQHGFEAMTWSKLAVKPISEIGTLNGSSSDRCAITMLATRPRRKPCTSASVNPIWATQPIGSQKRNG